MHLLLIKRVIKLMHQENGYTETYTDPSEGIHSRNSKKTWLRMKFKCQERKRKIVMLPGGEQINFRWGSLGRQWTVESERSMRLMLRSCPRDRCTCGDVWQRKENWG